MNTKTTNIVLLTLIVLTGGIGLFLYPSLPAEIASHWNAAGEVNGYMSKFWGVALFPLLMAGLFLIYFVIPKIDPLKSNINSFRSYYNAFWIFLFIFFSYIFGLSMAWSLGYTFNFTYAIVPAISALFYFLGSMLGKSKRNWFIGIRTPWTLSSDAVWDKTHRVASKLFKVAAIISLGALFAGPDAVLFFVVLPIAIVAIFAVVYSYLEYRKKN